MKWVFVLLVATVLQTGCATVSGGGDRPGAAKESADRVLKARVKKAQARYLYAVRSRELTRGVLRLAETQRQLARERYADGLASREDMVRAQRPAAELRHELAVQTRTLRKAERELVALTRRPALPEPQPSWRAVPRKTELEYLWLAGSLNTANQDFLAQDRPLRRAGLIRQVTETNRYPSLEAGTPLPAAVDTLIRTPLQPDTRARKQDAAPWWWRQRDKTGAARLAELVEHLHALPAPGPARGDMRTVRVARAEADFEAALARHDAGRKGLGTLLEAQLRIRQARQEQLKLELERQERLVDIERLLGEKL